MSKVGGRDRGLIAGLLAIVAIWVAIAFGSNIVGLFTGPHKPPFDLSRAGTACRDDRAWTCGSLTVPFDRTAPTSGTLQVHFRVLPRQFTDARSAGTIVVVAGGPGQPAMDQYPWAKFWFRSYLADHDLLLVDNRGTGASEAIDCPLLQSQQPYVSDAGVKACREQLGTRADDYGTVAAVDDLDAILTKLDAARVDMYSESYGTFFAQVFAQRHPERLQRLVLDGAYPLDVDPWSSDRLPAAFAGLRAVCKADPRCRATGDPVALLGRVLPALREGTLHARTSDAFGRAVDQPGSIADLAFALDEAGRDGTVFRELPPALTAAAGSPPDLVPLLRLLAERHRPVLGSSRVETKAATSFSVGLLLADSCSDYPHPFALTSSASSQTEVLFRARQSFIAAHQNAYAPFITGSVTRNGTECVGWPAPENPTPSVAKTRFPHVPTLVLAGALDTITPSPGARAVARAFPDSHYLVVPHAGHVTAFADTTYCASGIAAHFLATGAVDPSCLTRLTAPSMVESFATRRAAESPAVPELASSTASVATDDLRTIAVVRDAISDGIWRWARVGILSGQGLRGGTFTATGPLELGDAELDLRGVRWTTDTAVTGRLLVSPRTDSISGTVVVTTSDGRATLAVHSSLFGRRAVMQFTGTVNGHAVDVLTPAPLDL